jgi:hypothetical protein
MGQIISLNTRQVNHQLYTVQDMNIPNGYRGGILTQEIQRRKHYGLQDTGQQNRPLKVH